jgi:hypothetical protein
VGRVKWSGDSEQAASASQRDITRSAAAMKSERFKTLTTTSSNACRH